MLNEPLVEVFSELPRKSSPNFVNCFRQSSKNARKRLYGLRITLGLAILGLEIAKRYSKLEKVERLKVAKKLPSILWKALIPFWGRRRPSQA